MAEASGEEAKLWDTAQYEAALDHLARLQEQLDGLRATIPSIVSPLTKSGGDKAVLLSEIKNAALHSTSDLRAFRDSWTSGKTQDILTKGKESLQKDTDLEKAADVPRWGWGGDEEK